MVANMSSTGVNYDPFLKYRGFCNGALPPLATDVSISTTGHSGRAKEGSKEIQDSQAMSGKKVNERDPRPCLERRS